MYEVDTEQAILGCMLNMDLEDQQLSTKELIGEMFYDPTHQLIYETIKRLNESGSIGDIVTLPEELRKDDKLHHVGGVEYLLELVSGVSSPANIEFYKARLRKSYHQRLWFNVGKDILKAAQQGDTEACYQLSQLNKDLFSGVDKLKKFSQVWIEHQQDDTPKDKLFDSGIVGIDSSVEFCRKRLVLLAARPKTGKTSLACNLLCNIPNRLKSLFFSMEMDSATVASWMTAIMSGRERTFCYKSPKSIVGINDKNVYIDDSGRQSLDNIEMGIAKHRPDIVIVDNLQKFPSGRDRVNTYANILCSLSDMAKKYNITMILLAQINREIEKQKRAKPMMADLKDTGAAEEQPDVVIGLYQEDGLIKGTVLKNRHGADGQAFEIYFNKFTGKMM